MATKKAVEAANTAENNEPLNSIAEKEKNEARPGNESTAVSEGESIYTINEFAKAAATAFERPVKRKPNRKLRGFRFAI